MIGSISQTTLHDCTLKLRDDALVRASLFPFFDNEGNTSSVMLVSKNSGTITLLDWPVEFRLGLLGRSLGHFTSRLINSDYDRADAIASLWHFDPWWVLGESRFTNHPAVPPLKETNIPGYDKSIAAIYFAPDLSRVTWYGVHSESGMKLKRFKPEMLTELAAKRSSLSSPRPPARKNTWTLSPFWQR